MNSNFEVGVIWAVNGNQVTIKMNSITSDFTYFYNGEEYEGIRNGGYLSITRGHIDIICQIESEEIKDNYQKESKNKYKENERYEKFVYARCIGFFENEKFNFGIKYSPIIYNTVKMISSNTIKAILSPKKEKNEIEFVIGKDLQYGLKIDLPWNKIFNTHIGIFGNTGSGKSNTLTNLYKILLNHEKLNLENSKFVFIDFNGEYIGDKVLCRNKITYELNTRQDNKGDKFPIKSSSFWDEEVLSILFHATEKTQKPFLKNLIERRTKYLKENPNIKENLESYIKKIYNNIFNGTNPKKETLDLIKKVLEKINNPRPILEKFKWFNGKEGGSFVYTGDNNEIIYSNSIKKNERIDLNRILDIKSIKLKEGFSTFDELEIRARLDLINGVLSNFVQYEHIHPLLERIESISVSLKKIINIVEENNSNENNSNKNNLEVISLRNCNQEIKKMFPILLAKEYFREHKIKNESEVKNTFHLIIDEAHNILSQQSNREAESWKDYRLELFEEIIKEGRKFGFFLTVASQRPADISETIMSQFHNFFIHRLINEKDLRLIDNVISTLDRSSKQLIPVLPQGACIVTGTAFDFPQIIQVDKIEDREERPNSDDIDLEELWKKNNGSNSSTGNTETKKLKQL
ncbi:ATP-binding protein [Fusobacterium sp. 1001295B_180824_G3]|uniref:ATP-binding protein n=1 Tax=Fusobacterium sp. 1001295B_180824_G3 TaxID=2787123 RepID=UPI00189775D8|nr:ATP-binding protein [Fusobacterium sp. 1001295B_180824_G3]